jgi:hypothetical protein
MIWMVEVFVRRFSGGPVHYSTVVACESITKGGIDN